ncbi:hypothetical protein HAX54_027499, partial [Datura stramonium]|nr:hypothetical protein [Datura stramonium]
TQRLRVLRKTKLLWNAKLNLKLFFGADFPIVKCDLDMSHLESYMFVLKEEEKLLTLKETV